MSIILYFWYGFKAFPFQFALFRSKKTGVSDEKNLKLEEKIFFVIKCRKMHKKCHKYNKNLFTISKMCGIMSL